MPDPDSSAVRKKLALMLLEKVFLPFAMVIVGIVVFKPLEKWWSGPDPYKIYLVGRIDQSEIKKMFRTIQDDSALARLKIDGRDIVVEEVDDQGDLNTAQKIAADLSKRDDTLMVIGHVLSQSTMSALPVYMTASPQIPVIATRESNNNLLRNVKPDCRNSDFYCPVLTLSPTDSDQVKTALDYVITMRHKTKFLLVREKNDHNMEYVQSLSQQFQGEIDTRQGQIVDTVELGSDGSLAQLDAVSQEILRYSPDCILYIGQLRSAVAVVKTVSNMTISDTSKRPLILLSDSAVGDALLYSPIEIYAMFPVNGEQYRSISNVYGDDAFALVTALVKQVNDEHLVGQINFLHRILNMHRVQDSRAALIRKMQQNANNGNPYNGTTGRIYRYVAKYELQNIHFHIWKILDQKIIDVDPQDGVIVSKTLLRKERKSPVVAMSVRRSRSLTQSILHVLPDATSSP